MLPNALENLPAQIDEETARRFVGKCWDDADWESISGGTGTIAKYTFVTTVKIRSHAPSLRAWLEYWRIDELLDRMEDLEVMCADDLCDIDPQTLAKFVSSLKVVQKVHWEKAFAHAQYLKKNPLGYMPWRPEGLQMWLESWRLERIRPSLFDLGVDVKEDIIDLESSDFSAIDMRLLERKRWDEAYSNLTNLIENFDYASQRKASIPSISTWLKSLKLDRVRLQIEAYGAVELVDLDDVDERQFKELGLTQLQAKHWRIGLNQIEAAKREAMADGKADLYTFRGYLENWRLLRLHEQLVLLGAVVQQDMLDLEPSEYALLKMRPLEAKRFEQMMIALEEEFEKPPPGEAWTEDNMTRRAWRKKNAETYHYSAPNKEHQDVVPPLMSKTVGAKGTTTRRGEAAAESARSDRSQRNRMRTTK